MLNKIATFAQQSKMLPKIFANVFFNLTKIQVLWIVLLLNKTKRILQINPKPF